MCGCVCMCVRGHVSVHTCECTCTSRVCMCVLATSMDSLIFHSWLNESWHIGVCAMTHLDSSRFAMADLCCFYEPWRIHVCHDVFTCAIWVVPRRNESCQIRTRTHTHTHTHTYILTSHGAGRFQVTNCVIYKCNASWHMWICHQSRHVITWMMSHISCPTCQWVMSHIWMSHITHMNNSCHTY